MTKSDHIKLHLTGKFHSEETKAKMKASAHKGSDNPACRPEVRKKISESCKGRVTKGNTGMHWYNNGLINQQAFECPEGFRKGRLH